MKTVFRKSKVILQHKNHRTALLASFTTLRNFTYSAGMFILALWSNSLFLLINGSYQLILSLIRILNIHSYARWQHGTSHYRKHISHLTGTLLVLLGAIYIGLNIYFYVAVPSENISKLSMLLTATLAFIKLGSSICGIISNRHHQAPEISNIRLLNLVDAIVSLISTQRVILTFVEGSQVALKSTPIFGIVMGICFIAIGVWIVFRKIDCTRHLKLF